MSAWIFQVGQYNHKGLYNRESGELCEKRRTDRSRVRDEFGGEALAGFACSRSTNEDIYMLQKMVRTAFKSNNTDNCARV